VKKIVFLLSLTFILCFGLAYAQSDDISAAGFYSLSVERSPGFNHLHLGIKGRRAGFFEGIIQPQKAMEKSLEYFFLGLLLQENSFWVNLNPNEPARIIDPVLANTDLGRIMLNADLRLKEDVAELLNPQTSAPGREFWKRLYEKAELLNSNKIPFTTRLWIVPGKVLVSEKDNKISILESELKVTLESAQLPYEEPKDKTLKELQDFSSELMEELILPALNKRVNSSYTYADLRDVYQALILALWYKQNFSSQDALLQSVNFGILKELEDDYTFSPDEIYQEYLRSFKNGEYSFREPAPFSDFSYASVSVRHYFSGGVDLRNIRLAKTSSSPIEDNTKDSVFFSCDLLIPRNIDKPLQYAKSQAEVIKGIAAQDSFSTIMLAHSLPAVAPVNLPERNLKTIDYIAKAEQIVLSKL